MPVPKTTIDTAAMQRHIDLLENSPQILAQVVLDVTNVNKPHILDDLGHIPPRSRKKVEWETPRQMRAYFATDGFGKGIPSRRTGKKPTGWKVEVDQLGGVMTIVIKNTWNAARYVFGNLTGNPKGTQQRMHANTGWELASPKLNKWFTELNDQIYTVYRKRIKQERRKR